MINATLIFHMKKKCENFISIRNKVIRIINKIFVNVILSNIFFIIIK